MLWNKTLFRKYLYLYIIWCILIINIPVCNIWILSSRQTQIIKSVVHLYEYQHNIITHSMINIQNMYKCLSLIHVPAPNRNFCFHFCQCIFQYFQSRRRFPFFPKFFFCLSKVNDNEMKVLWGGGDITSTPTFMCNKIVILFIIWK